jgi:hypothetical protein
MFSRHSISQTLRVGACGAVILLSTAQAKADAKDKRACKAAYKSAVSREQAGHLREARDLLSSCMRSACGAVQKKCDAKAAQLNVDIPTIVPVVTDGAGGNRTDVQLRMDGELLAARLDGSALFVDPGMHDFAFSSPDRGTFATQRIVIVQGQRNRTIVASLPSERHDSTKRTLAASTTRSEPRAALEPSGEQPEASKAASDKSSSAGHEPSPVSSEPEARSSGGPGALPYVVGGVGLAAVGAGALVTLWGNKDNDKLGGCSPNCAQASVDHVRTLYTVADVTIGVGIVAVGVATYLLATSGPSKEKPKTAYVVDVKPTPAGAFASVSGAF